jgi:hypothetical protein
VQEDNVFKVARKTSGSITFKETNIKVPGSARSDTEDPSLLGCICQVE